MLVSTPPAPLVAHHSPYTCNRGSRHWTVREARCVVRIVFRGHQLSRWLGIAACESGFDTYSVSPTGDWSVFQINRSAHPDYFVGAWRWRHRFDPVYNARYALRLSRNGTTSAAWVCQ